MADKADNELRKEFDTLKADFSKLQADTSDLLDELREVAAKKAKSARVKIKGHIDDGEDEVKNRLHDARIKGRELMGNMEGHIADYPVTSLVAAFGVGFAVAKLLGSRVSE